MKIATLIAITAILFAQASWAQDAPRLRCADADKDCAQEATRSIHSSISRGPSLYASTSPGDDCGVPDNP